MHVCANAYEGVGEGVRERGWIYILLKLAPSQILMFQRAEEEGRRGPTQGGRGMEKEAVQNMCVTCSELHGQRWSLDLGSRSLGFKPSL